MIPVGEEAVGLFWEPKKDPLSVEYHVIYIGFISCCPLHQFSPSIHNYRNTDLALIELNILSLMALWMAIKELTNLSLMALWMAIKELTIFINGVVNGH